MGEQSMKDALWAIANMQVKDDTDKAETLALCMSIAKIELSKLESEKPVKTDYRKLGFMHGLAPAANKQFITD